MRNTNTIARINPSPDKFYGIFNSHSLHSLLLIEGVLFVLDDFIPSFTHLPIIYFANINNEFIGICSIHFLYVKRQCTARYY